MNAYGDLKPARSRPDEFFFEDVLGDGLVAVPAKNGWPTR